ncbi:MAG: hypothetical protein K9H49_09190 [Bacteroidales bacterium]|nr:hypothetical protein [Bacteroidales bacterium]MCF8391826.1 hypothetical protein [Bacteroidales bacterium]
MEKRDYLMMQFEQLGIVLAALLGFKETGEYKKALEIISESYTEIPGFNPETLKIPDPQQFLALQLLEIPVSFQKLNLIANFIYEEGDFQFLAGNASEAINQFKKALVIYHYLNVNEKIYSFERQEKITKMNSIIDKNL